MITAIQFVTLAAKLIPSTEELEHAGLSPAELADIQAVYRLQQRVKPLQMANPPNELVRLLSEWDCSRFELVSLRFTLPTLCNTELRIGYREADPIHLLENGTVVMINHASETERTVIARDGNTFLDALAFIIEVQANSKQLQKRKMEIVAKCQEIAKARAQGNDFWRSMIPLKG